MGKTPIKNSKIAFLTNTPTYLNTYIRFMLKQLFKRGEDIFLINRKIPVHNFEIKGELDLELVKLWRDFLRCDHVLRDQTYFIFVETIEDIEFEIIESHEQD